MAIFSLSQWLTLGIIRNLKYVWLHWKAVISREWPFSSPLFLLPSIDSKPSIKLTQYAGVSHLVTDMQNNNTLHSTLIAPFIQEYPSPLQAIIKLLLPHGTPLSSLYWWGSTKPRKVNFPRSQELVTELRRKSQHQQLSQHRHFPLPRMPDPGIHGKPCLPIFLMAHSHLAP